MVKSKPKARRLLGMGSRRFSSPEPVSPSFDKENNSVACISHTTSASPQKVHICYIFFFVFFFIFINFTQIFFSLNFEKT